MKNVCTFLGCLGLAVLLLQSANAVPESLQNPAPAAVNLEQKIIEKINGARRAAGMRPLQPDPTLSQVAREHSEEMMRRGITTHESLTPGKKTPEDRYKLAFGTQAAKLGENVARVERGYSDEATAISANISLTSRREDFAKTADPELSMMGLGCAVGRDGAVWVTALFAAPAARPQTGPPGSKPAVLKPQVPPETQPSTVKPVKPDIPPDRLPPGTGTTIATYQGSITAEFQSFLDDVRKTAGGQILRVERKAPASEMQIRLAENKTYSWQWSGSDAQYFVAGQGGGAGEDWIRFSIDLNCGEGTLKPDGSISGDVEIKIKMEGYSASARQPMLQSGGGKSTWEARPRDAAGSEYAVTIKSLLNDKPAFNFHLVSGPAPGSAVTPQPTRSRLYIPPSRPTRPGPQPVDPAEALRRLDEDRAADILWIQSIEEALEAAQEKRAQVRGVLLGQAQMIKMLTQNIARLRRMLARVPTDESLTNLEEFFSIAIRQWDRSWGPPPLVGRDLRPAVRAQISELEQRISEIQREQDELIQTTLASCYDPITQELRLRGTRSAWAEVRNLAQSLEAETIGLSELTKAEFYFAAGRPNEFRAAARACYARGTFAADVRFLEGLNYHTTGNYQLALASFRRVAAMTGRDSIPGRPLTEEEANRLIREGGLHDRARAIAWTLEHAFLHAIDEKAGGEAAQVRTDADEAMQRGGSEGKIGFILAYFNMGVVSALKGFHSETLANLTGNQAWNQSTLDALENAASQFQQDVGAQHCGLLLAQSLHERGVPLQGMDRLSNAKFLELMREHFPGVAGRLTAADSFRMRASIKAAFANPDVARLASGSTQMLDVATGADQFDRRDYMQDEIGYWGDTINPLNLSTMLVPMAVHRIGGALAKPGLWLPGAMPVGKVTMAKEAFSAWTGLSQIPSLVAGTRSGQALMAQFTRFFAKSTWLEDRALDMTIQLALGTAAEEAGWTTGVLLGSDGKTEAELARMLMDLVTAWGVGDVDVMKGLLKKANVPAEAVRRYLAEAVAKGKSAGQLAASVEQDLTSLRRSLPAQAGALPTSEQKRLAGVKKGELLRKIDDQLYQIRSGNANAEVFQNLDAIKIEYGAAEALEKGEGMVEQAKAWIKLAEERQRKAMERSVRLGEISRRLEQSAAGNPPVAVTLPTPASIPSQATEIPDFRRGVAVTQDLDRLYLEGKYAEALAKIEERHTLLSLLGIGNAPEVRAGDMPKKIAWLREVEHVKAKANQVPPPPAGYLNTVSKTEIEQLVAADKIYLVPMETKTLNETFWAYERRPEGDVKIGAWKKTKNAGLDLKAEVASSKLSKLWGFEVPDYVIVKMNAGNGMESGVFSRYMGGTELGDLGIAAPVAFKEQMASDKALSMIFGDHDRRPANIRITSPQRAHGLDHAESDFLGRIFGEGDLFPAGSALPGAGDKVISDLIDKRIAEAMIERQNVFRRGYPSARLIESNLISEDLIPKLRTIKQCLDNPACANNTKAILIEIYGETDGKLAMEIITRRARVAEKVARDLYGTLDDVRPIPWPKQPEPAPQSAAGSGLEDSIFGLFAKSALAEK